MGSRLIAFCAAHEPDLIICAGFMKLIGAPFLASFGDRYLDTHPALHAVRRRLGNRLGTDSGLTRG
jgi:folate-dependent phosphoribosylglycinamide formyltransferase PurN